MTTRRRFTGEFKARVALEALRGDKTVQEIYGGSGMLVRRSGSSSPTDGAGTERGRE